MRTISSSERFRCGAQAPPEIGEDYVPHCPRCFPKRQRQTSCHTRPGESEPRQGSKCHCHTGKFSRRFGRILSLSRALSQGRLSAHHRELLSLTIAQENECQYCLSAHTATAKASGISPSDVVKAREGKSDHPFERALTSFAKNVIRNRGLVSDQDLEATRMAGIDDGLMLEIVANVALNTLTNYANRLADPSIDFPVVEVKL
jgi:uncharacterized peroxidase-related enzyme